MRFLCFYARLMATELCFAYFAALKTVQNSILTFFSKCYPRKKQDGRITFTGLVMGLLPPCLDYRRGMPAPILQTFAPLAFTPALLQNTEQKPLLRMNSMENKTSFMKLVVHDCQVNHRYWNYDKHLVRRLVVS